MTPFFKKSLAICFCNLFRIFAGMKTRQFISSVVTFLIAVVFLLTSTGFNVYIHHCSSTNSSKYTVLIKDFSCDHSYSAHGEDKPSFSSCCSAPLKDSTFVEGDCCYTVSHFLRITDSYQHNNVVSFVKLPLFIEFNLQLTTITPLEEDLLPSELCYSPPPLMYGFDQLVFIHQLKIPSFS